jgi:DNA-binding MarR family transcriptional regulator
MNSKEFNVLRIFKEIGENQCISQRAIADRLEISLGLVNSVIKNLVGKGYFKVFQTTGKKLKYLLTQEGASEKIRLTYEYFNYVVDLSIITNSTLNEIIEVLKKDKVTNIVLFGFGSIAQVLLQLMSEMGLNPVAIVDDRRIGHECYGLKVIGIQDLVGVSYDRIVVTDYDDHRYNLDKITELGVSKESLMILDNNLSAGFL